MKRTPERERQLYRHRVTAIIVAVVFVLGTAILPADIYGAETEATDSNAAAVEATDVAETEAEKAAAEENTAEKSSIEATKAEEQDAIAEEAATDAAATENAEAVTEEEAATDEAVVEELTEAVEADLDQLDESEYDGFIYKLKDDTTTKELKEMESAIDDLSEDQEVSEVIEEEIYTADSIETIAEVAEPETIEYIEPDYIVKACGPNDPDYVDKAYGWYLDQIKAPYVWNKGSFGKGVKIAVLDSGVKTDHAELESTNFILPYNTIEESEDITDNSGHGTGVAGVLAASYNNEKGLTGIVPDATIIPVKVMDLRVNEEGKNETAGTISDSVEGIEYAIKNGASVINISAGTTDNSITMKEACQKAAAKGIIMVAAAGNFGDTTNDLLYPASYSTVISVASNEKDGAHSSFSNHNKYVTVSAPGRGIKTPYKNGGFAVYTGTSFSAPQVSAMAVMAKSLKSSINYTGFVNLIKATATDKGTKGYDTYYGYGLMDLSKAYRYLAGDIFMYSASLSTTSYVYNNTVKTPAVTLKNGAKTLEKSKYKVDYPTGRKAVGTYKVTVRNVGKFTGIKTLTFKIMPPLVRALKSPVRYKKKLKVRWYAMTSSQKTKYKGGITGYQVRVSRYSSFKNAKYVKVTGATKTYAVVKNLKRKTTYYIQYRSYKTVGSTTYYSKWSSKKKTRTR